MSEKKLTPMLQQYFDIKKDHQEAFLFFRLGDFYEMFADDAKEAARLLGLTLTARHKGGPNEIAMCGVPHHSADRYIAQLTKMGKRIAICDQVSDPNLPGIVQRAVTKIITPGTSFDDSVRDTKQNNYLVSLKRSSEKIGVSFLDLATGEFRLIEMQDLQALRNLLFMIDPTEILVEDQEHWLDFQEDWAARSVAHYTLPYFEKADEFLKKHFQVSTLSGFGIDPFPLGIEAAAALLSYAKETQKTDLEHLKKITLYRFKDLMMLDESTIRNLELFHTSKDFHKQGSLLSVIDKTITRMGARKLRQWVLGPLLEKEKIENRLDAVEELGDQESLRNEVQTELKEFFDLERLVGRIGCRAVNARDLNYLKVNLLKVPILKSILSEVKSDLLQQLQKSLDPLQELVGILDQCISSDPPVTLTEGGMIAEGFHDELDELRKILKNGNEWLMNYQQELREHSSINNLKVKFNKVFGYHIEVSKGQSEKVPQHFELKQTLVNAFRYTTSELKDFEQKFLSAEEKIKQLEYELFQETLEKVIPFLESIQKNADDVAHLDVLQSMSQIALEKHYCRPQIKEEKGIDIEEGRHPVIEHILHQQHQAYIANDTKMNDQEQLVVLTGPNMAGKSSYLRQVALIVLLAHMGSFVPAKSASIGLTDRIFTRVGASDDISRGQSTFMVEMTEAANILNNASDRSLIIFDELGRGTSTYDGVSIAWAVLEYVAHQVKALTLFATHYHELIDVAKEIPNASNASIAVSEKEGEIVFLRKIIPEGVDRSYGIEVAQLAGLPESVITRARSILEELEKDRFQEEQHLMGIQPSLFMTSTQQNIIDPEQEKHRSISQKLKEAKIDEMTPIQALNYLHELKKNL